MGGFGAEIIGAIVSFLLGLIGGGATVRLIDRRKYKFSIRTKAKADNSIRTEAKTKSTVKVRADQITTINTINHFYMGCSLCHNELDKSENGG